MALGAGNGCQRVPVISCALVFLHFSYKKKHLQNMYIYIYSKDKFTKSWVFFHGFEILKHDCFDLTHGFVKKRGKLEFRKLDLLLLKLGFHCLFVPWKLFVRFNGVPWCIVCLILRCLLSKLSITWDLLQKTGSSMQCLYFPWFVSSHLTWSFLSFLVWETPEAFTLNGW